MNRRRWLVACVVAATVSWSCGGGGDGFVNTGPTPAQVVVSMSPSTGTVNAGATTAFAVTITGGSPVPTLSMCSSSNSAIATAVANGSSCSVTGVAGGSATITATSSTGQAATAQVTVTSLPAALTAFTLTPLTASLTVGQTLALTATPVTAAGATVSIGYQSGNVAVATVSGSGVVTAVGVGSVVITATAQAAGTNLTPTSISRTATIAITGNPCAAVSLALPVTRNGSVTASSCALTTDSQRRGDVLRVNLAEPAAVELRFTPTGFPGYISAFPAGESEFVFFTGNSSQEVRNTYHLPSGLTEFKIGAATAGQTGTYSFSATLVSGNVTGCKPVVVAGTLISTQALASSDCVYSSRLADEFLVFSSRPCVITMTRVDAPGGVTNPYLEVYAGGQLVAFDNDGGGNGNARISLTSCRSPANDVLIIRATSFGVGDSGNYVFGVSLGQ